MTDKSTALPKMPQTGGSYTRSDKGVLKQVAKPTAEQPTRKAVSTKSTPKET